MTAGSVVLEDDGNERRSALPRRSVLAKDGMTFWRRVLFWLVPLFVGRAMNLWQIQVHGFMPIYTFWGDWIPVAGRWLFSIGDVLQIMAFIEILELLVIRELDKRYMRRPM